MGQFDAALWNRRAWGRYARAAVRLNNEGKEAAARAWRVDLSAIDDLEKVVTWCRARGVSVSFEKRTDGVYHIGRKQISISGRLKPLNQLVVLLHECGHHLIGDGEHHGRFGLGYSQTDPKVIRTFNHRVTILDEEMDAWYRGWKLARRLKLNLDKESFDKMRLQCLKSYLQWCMRPGPTPKEE